jgi:hypothetical protein
LEVFRPAILGGVPVWIELGGEDRDIEAEDIGVVVLGGDEITLSKESFDEHQRT